MPQHKPITDNSTKHAKPRIFIRFYPIHDFSANRIGPEWIN